MSYPFFLRFSHRCSTLVRLSSERLTRRLREMAEPSVVKDASALKHEALSSYETATALLQHKVDFPPDKDSTSKVVDEWISDAYLQWVICSNFWRPTGIKKAAWDDVEYSLLACLPLVNRELLDDSGGRFNELVHRAVRLLSPWSGLVVLTCPLYFQHKYSIPNLRPVPLDTPSPSPEPALRVRTPVPAPPRTTTPAPQQPTTSAANPAAHISSSNVRAPGSASFNISKPPMPRFTTPLATPTGQSSMTQKSKVKARPVTSIPVQRSEAASSTEPFPKDWTSPLHRKPGQQFNFGPSKDSTRSEVSIEASSRVLAVNGRYFCSLFFITALTPFVIQLLTVPMLFLVLTLFEKVASLCFLACSSLYSFLVQMTK